MKLIVYRSNIPSFNFVKNMYYLFYLRSVIWFSMPTSHHKLFQALRTLLRYPFYIRSMSLLIYFFNKSLCIFELIIRYSSTYQFPQDNRETIDICFSCIIIVIKYLRCNPFLYNSIITISAGYF